MNFKINSIIISSFLAFALIAAMIPATFAQTNTEMTPEGGNMTGMTQDGNMTQGQSGNMTGMTQDGNMTQGQSGNMTGMTQGQTSDDDDDDGDDDDKDDGDDEDDKDEGE
jgi:hypothetical protein